MKNYNLDNFLLNQEWNLREFDCLDLEKAKPIEKVFYSLIRTLKEKGQEINGENIFKLAKEKDQSIATKILLLFMVKSISIDKFRFKTK